MSRKIKGNMPDFQERVLMAMYACLIDPSGTQGSWLQFQQGRGIAHALGGVWSTYRHRQMLELQKQGAVVCHKTYMSKPTWYYALTSKGVMRTREIIAVARRNEFTVRTETFMSVGRGQSDFFDTVYHSLSSQPLGFEGEAIDDIPI